MDNVVILAVLLLLMKLVVVHLEDAVVVDIMIIMWYFLCCCCWWRSYCSSWICLLIMLAKLCWWYLLCCCCWWRSCCCSWRYWWFYECCDICCFAVLLLLIKKLSFLNMFAEDAVLIILWYLCYCCWRISYCSSWRCDADEVVLIMLRYLLCSCFWWKSSWRWWCWHSYVDNVVIFPMLLLLIKKINFLKLLAEEVIVVLENDFYRCWWSCLDNDLLIITLLLPFR